MFWLRALGLALLGAIAAVAIDQLLVRTLGRSYFLLPRDLFLWGIWPWVALLGAFLLHWRFPTPTAALLIHSLVLNFTALIYLLMMGVLQPMTLVPLVGLGLSTFAFRRMLSL